MGLIHKLILTAALSGAAVAAQAAEARFDRFTYSGNDPVYATVKPGPGDYLNPILAGFYPDPSITQVGGDYYLINSTFAYFPGIPIFHSRDLVNWTQIGNAIDRPGQLKFDGLRTSRAVFAPAIEHHNGVFYIANTCIDCGGNFIVTAKDPAGPWSDPIWLPEFDGIDPSLFFDEGGKVWLVNNGPPEGTPLYEGHRAIWIQEFDLAAIKLTGPRRVLVNGGVDLAKKPIWAEGPHIFKRNGWYYLIAAEGGTAEDHSQTVYRARTLDGPFVPWERNPILTQRHLPADRPFPITSAGHADFVQAPGGEWWTIFLATRPYADDHYNTGRETFLLPVTWTDDDWPMILAGDATIPVVHKRPNLPPQPAPKIPTHGDFTVVEDFEGKALPPYWLTIRTPKTAWWRLDGGALALDARPDAVGDLSAQPSFWGRRQQHTNMTATTTVRFTPEKNGDKAGLLAMQSDEHFYFLGLVRDGGRDVVRLERRSGQAAPVVVASAPVTLAPGAPLDLKVEARGGTYDFSYAAQPGRWTVLAKDADGRILSTKTAGGFVGVLIGPYAQSGQ
ncbi:glycoside hydrolase family 43 protein [Caulobacter sp. NIBR2454]|uniref:glycoside hydrolase family 43 protein n=1 Tax=Caulobacter sp. NIBR2454 TaxID=3015996 RepID=UPI0022B70F42|nr:glycoside hydrolase family 43 protein [Caulobacter sp. NIBR2454]